MFKVNRLLKILVLVLFMGIMFGSNRGNVKAMTDYKVEGRTLIIHIKQNGDVANSLSFVTDDKGPYDRLVVKGVMHYTEFFKLEMIGIDCKSIDLSELKAKGIPLGSFCQRDKLEEFIFPTYMETISSKVLCDCQNLRKCILPKNLKIVGDYTFQYCEKLILTIPQKVKVGKDVGEGSPGVILPVPSCTIL